MDMKEIWAEYETRRAAGDHEASEIIGEVYTALDMLDMDGENAPEDYLLNTYNAICSLSWNREKLRFGKLHEIKMALEDEMVKAGFLEGDEPEEADEYDSETNWDEWMADQRYDMYRDMELTMRYER